jgi:histidinol-phosphate aminotransferase
MIPVPQQIESLRPYEPGKPIEEVERELGIHNVIKLASNENPFGSSPKAIDAIRRSLARLEQYPDAGRTLRGLLADKYVVTVDNVVCGAGSESIIAAALRGYLGPEDEIVSSAGTFVGFQVLAHITGNTSHFSPLRGYKYDLSAMEANLNENTRIVYIANPNNPTGTIVSTNELERFVEKVPKNVLIILDEAYFEYACEYPDYPDSMRWRWDNVLTCRTFSKAYGLAGMRIGYGIAHSEIVQTIMKVKLPFEPSTPATAAGCAAIEDEDFLTKTVEQNRNSLRYLHAEFERMELNYVPSLANFVMIDFGLRETVDRVYEGLLRRGVITRPLKGFGLPGCLRITTGTDEQNERCVHTLEEVLAEEEVK